MCNTVYRIDLAPVSWRRGEVPDYPGGCADPALIDDESILEAMIQRLSQERFDVTSLEYILFDLKNGSASAD